MTPTSQRLCRLLGRKKMWKYTFDETGGYDCMTGAFHIWDGNRILMTIDQSAFGQTRCDYECKSFEAEYLAKKVVELLNKSEQGTDA
jgi:hypothetical protein